MIPVDNSLPAVAGPDGIPILRYSTSDLPPDQRYSAWLRRAWPRAGAIFHTQPTEPFDTTWESAQLDLVTFVHTKITGMRWERRQRDIRTSDFDPIVVTMMVEGLAQGDCDGILGVAERYVRPWLHGNEQGIRLIDRELMVEHAERNDGELFLPGRLEDQRGPAIEGHGVERALEPAIRHGRQRSTRTTDRPQAARTARSGVPSGRGGKRSSARTRRSDTARAPMFRLWRATQAPP